MIQRSFTYDAFGKLVGESGNAGVDTRYRFTGREWDGESQQYYYRARYYDANTGRFIGQDPLGFAAGDSNLYRYVGNSPAMATDPSGEIAVAAVVLPVVAGLAANMLQPEPAQAPMNARDNHPDPNQVLREAATEVALTGGVGLVKKGAEHGLKRGASTALGKALIKGKDKLFKLGGNAADTLSILGKDCIDDLLRSTAKPLSTCFVAGTLVLTETGMTPIESIQKGDRVWSYHHDASTWELRTVLQPLVHEYAGDIITLVVAGEIIQATATHPFWVIGNETLNLRPSATEIPLEEQAYFAGGRWIEAQHL
ncbi:RHS repeat-associated core domain-containing protein [Alkalinema sp. FACHB-956]|uniref:RHS repeat-associated core domain-containing protein n=1 Tax=Alkalinema sp. FACHB-956 TaxID=2692768 RepID=UPI0032201F2B